MQFLKTLIADDDRLNLGFLREALLRKNLDVLAVSSGEEAINCISQQSFDIIITDFKMQRANGIDVLKKAKAVNPKAIVIISTAFASMDNAVEALNLGAFHYLIKPFSLEALDAVLEKAFQHLALVKENEFLKEELSSPGYIAESPSMKKIVRDIGKIAKSNASVFIFGESGTGKEVIAETIHGMSNRASKPFVKINCAAVPETLIESEFFGHERGSFTGADMRKIGRFEVASGGTLLLDEVTEIPISIQAKLLRAIQEEEFERIGSTKPLHVDIRFIATSNRNMKEAIEKKTFREDLFYRLNVIPIHLSPLRERKEDILPLANFFLARLCKENHKPLKTVTDDAKEKLLTYSWPGNVRELANIMERVVVMDFDQLIKIEHLFLDEVAAVPQTLDEIEKKAILDTLKNNNKTETAKKLGITLKTLSNKLKIYT